MSSIRYERPPMPEFKNEEGLTRTMTEHGMTLDQAMAYLDAEWKEWERVNAERKAAARVATHWQYEQVVRSLPPELNAQTLSRSTGKGRRVDVSLDALRALIAKSADV